METYRHFPISRSIMNFMLKSEQFTYAFFIVISLLRKKKEQELKPYSIN